MATLHMLIGIPGSGKSTYCKKYLIPKYPNAIYIASDKVRDNNPDMKEDQIWPEIYRLTSNALKDGYDVIYDATNITPKVRNRFKDTLKGLGVENFDSIAYFFNTNYKICEERVTLRNQNPNERYLPVDIIEGYGANLIAPTKEENFKNVVFIDNNENKNVD